MVTCKEVFGWFCLISIGMTITLLAFPFGVFVWIPLIMVFGHYGLLGETKPAKPWDNATYRTPWQR